MRFVREDSALGKILASRKKKEIKEAPLPAGHDHVMKHKGYFQRLECSVEGCKEVQHIEVEVEK